MGWLIYNAFESVPCPQAELDRICTWGDQGDGCRVLASAIVGRAYYAAARIERPNVQPRIVALVALFQRQPFGYKLMDETVGPNERRCPRQILELLTPIWPGDAWAAEWRRDCWAQFGGEPQGRQLQLV